MPAIATARLTPAKTATAILTQSGDNAAAPFCPRSDAMAEGSPPRLAVVVPAVVMLTLVTVLRVCVVPATSLPVTPSSLVAVVANALSEIVSVDDIENEEMFSQVPDATEVLLLGAIETGRTVVWVGLSGFVRVVRALAAVVLELVSVIPERRDRVVGDGTVLSSTGTTVVAVTEVISTVTSVMICALCGEVGMGSACCFAARVSGMPAAAMSAARDADTTLTVTVVTGLVLIVVIVTSAPSLPADEGKVGVVSGGG